jgi:hypothetical protein
MADEPTVASYLYQELFMLNEGLKKDGSSENIRLSLARNSILGNMVRLSAVEIMKKRHHVRSRTLIYSSDMVLTNKEGKLLEEETGYWEDPANIEMHLDQYKNSLANDDPERMPTHKELSEAGLNDLAMAIIDYHGGFEEVAKKLGLRFEK